MARVVVTETAMRELDSLTATRNLPDPTRGRIRALLTPVIASALRSSASRWGDAGRDLKHMNSAIAQAG